MSLPGGGALTELHVAILLGLTSGPLSHDDCDELFGPRYRATSHDVMKSLGDLELAGYARSGGGLWMLTLEGARAVGDGGERWRAHRVPIKRCPACRRHYTDPDTVGHVPVDPEIGGSAWDQGAATPRYACPNPDCGHECTMTCGHRDSRTRPGT